MHPKVQLLEGMICDPVNNGQMCVLKAGRNKRYQKPLASHKTDHLILPMKTHVTNYEETLSSQRKEMNTCITYDWRELEMSRWKL